MKVDHLYVIAIYASQDTSLAKREETRRTAAALYTRHGAKSKTAVHVDVHNLYGEACQCTIASSRGDSIPLGKQLAAPGALPAERSADTGATAGVYVVFHNDNGGYVIMPDSIAWLLTVIVPDWLHGALAKISLFACDVAGHEDGAPIRDAYGSDIAQFNSRRGSGFIGGIGIMLTLLQRFHDRGLHPMICGYDIPVFAGDGPLKATDPHTVEPARQLKRYVNGKWKDAAYDDPDIAGRKLVLHPTRDNRLTTMKSMQERSIRSGKGDHTALHKKVLQVNEQGIVCDALAGWSTRTG